MHVRPQLLAQPWHRLPCSLQTALMQCAVRGLTIRSSRTRFATPTTWQNSLPCCWLRYARRLNSSVRPHGEIHHNGTYTHLADGMRRDVTRGGARLLSISWARRSSLGWRAEGSGSCNATVEYAMPPS